MNKASLLHSPGTLPGFVVVLVTVLVVVLAPGTGVIYTLSNGVSELLKETVLKALHERFPERIVNQTNGITPGRWLLAEAM